MASTRSTSAIRRRTSCSMIRSRWVRRPASTKTSEKFWRRSSGCTVVQRRAPVSVPLITELQVVPVAGRDSMLLNLSGAHGPFFTRNIVILKDSAGHTGVGEVPGGEKIRQTIDDARTLLVGRPIGDHLR